MKGQNIGYIRVSTFEQNIDRQLEHENLDRTFVDKASGKNAERIQLQMMLDFIREGDTVVVHSMDRLARNLDDLRSLVKKMTSKGVKVRFVKEQLTFSNEDNAMANLLLSVMGAFAEFERALIKERQREGIELAKKRGAYKGRKKALNDEQIHEMLLRLQEGATKTAVAKEFNISLETLYKYIKIAEEQGKFAQNITVNL